MEVIQIEHGEIITKPGFYAMNIAWYHDDCCDGPSISSSGLRTIALDSPLHYWDTSYLNPDRDPDATPEIEAEHFRLGRASHWLTLEPHLYQQNIAVRPEDLFDSWRTAKSKEWREDRLKLGLTVLTAAEELKAKGAAAALRAHPLYQQGLLGGALEVSMIAKDAKTGIWIKSRPDAMPIEEATNDLKFVTSSKPEDVERSIRTLGYDMQAALGGIILEKLTQRTIDTHYITAIESHRPHAIHVATIGTAAVYWSRIRLRKALDQMGECLKTGVWYAYDQDGKPSEPTEYELKRFKELQKNALLPQEDSF